MIDLTGEGVDSGAALVRRVSHAVMNDLAVVRLLLDSATGPDVPPEVAANLAKAAAVVGDVADRLGQLGALARPGTGPVDVDLRDVVRRVEHLLDVAAGPAATVRVVLPDGPAPAVVDVREVQQALLADIAALGERVEPGSTINVGVVDGTLVVSTDAVALRS